MKDLVRDFEDVLIGNPSNFEPLNLERYISKHRVNRTHLLKALMALEYLSQLKSAGLEFIFKGGTGIQLILPDGWNRFSIDLDIQTTRKRDEIEDILLTIKARFGDRYFDFRPRAVAGDHSDWFSSFVVTIPTFGGADSTILLDVLHSPTNVQTLEIPIKSDFYDSPAVVSIPSCEALLADKLSTLGPNTIGSRLRDSRGGLNYTKHLFDLQSLLPLARNVEEVT